MSGQLVAFDMAMMVPERRLFLHLRPARPCFRLRIPAQVTWAVMGVGVGSLYGLALGHPALWIGVGVAAGALLCGAARKSGL